MKAKVTFTRILVSEEEIEGDTIEEIRKKALEQIARTMSNEFDEINEETIEIEEDEEQGIQEETLSSI